MEPAQTIFSETQKKKKNKENSCAKHSIYILKKKLNVEKKKGAKINKKQNVRAKRSSE